MGLFSRKKEQVPAKKAASKPPQSPKRPEIVITTLSPEPEPTAAEKKARRVSTIVEDEQHADFGGDDYENDEDSDYETEDDDYEEHDHLIIPRTPVSVSQLSALVGLCGLGPSTSKEAINKAANEELKRTVSLLSSNLKINRLLPTMSKADPHLMESVIGEKQMDLIKALTLLLSRIMAQLQDTTLQSELTKLHKTLYERYGSIKDVIGRGAYGVIKIIDPGDLGDGFVLRNKLYAVKELQRKGDKETSDSFIERAVSEFIVSSTLNSRHIVRTVDLLVTLPTVKHENIKISQVMECTSGGNLFLYVKHAVTSRQYISIDEIDCMIKQIAKGLWYMHNHGVAHCDLKLENILITYEDQLDPKPNSRGKMNLKLSDFGKSNVVRTKWDSVEELYPSSNGPIGSEPYMAPEEYVPSKKGYSLLKKDYWAFGILILVLFNLRRSYFLGKYGEFCTLQYYDEAAHEENTKSYSLAYLWRSTEPSGILSKGKRKFKDEGFDEYVKNAMTADYNKNTKEWTIHREGSFLPIETLFDMHLRDGETDARAHEDAAFEHDDYVLRKYFIYKMLDINPQTRCTVDMLLRGDWLRHVECCCE